MTLLKKQTRVSNATEQRSKKKPSESSLRNLELQEDKEEEELVSNVNKKDTWQENVQMQETKRGSQEDPKLAENVRKKVTLQENVLESKKLC